MNDEISPEEKSATEASEAVQNQLEGKMLGGFTGKGFMPGKSGNPSGKPKGVTASSMIREIGQEFVTTTDGVKLTRWQAMYRRLFELALDKKAKAADRVKATEFLTEHGFGKALERIHQEIDLSGGAIVPKAIVRISAQYSETSITNGQQDSLPKPVDT